MGNEIEEYLVEKGLIIKGRTPEDIRNGVSADCWSSYEKKPCKDVST